MRAVVAVAFLLYAIAVGLCGTQPAAAQPSPGAGEPSPPGPPRAKEPAELLREAGLLGSPEALAKFFSDRTPKAGTDRVPTLIRQLSSEGAGERKRASEGLLDLGPAAAGALMLSLTEKYGETRKLAKECLARLQARQDAVLCVLAVRELVRLAPEKAPALLLARLPYAWPGEREEIWLALVKPGRPEAVYARALSDKEGARRALAGFMLARYGSDAERKKAAALLKDPDREVRLRVAQGLLGAGSSEGVPALIGLLSKTPETVSWQAEELLRWWAGEQGPRPGGDWAAWWKGKPTVRQAEHRHRPRLVLVRERGRDEPDRLSLYGYDGRRRWSLEYRDVGPLLSRVAFLGDAGTVVSAERQWGQKFIRARDLQGRILWERPVALGWVPYPQDMAAGTVNTNIEVLTPWGGIVGEPPPHGRLPRPELPPAGGDRLRVEVEPGVVAELDGRGRVLWRAEVGGRLKALLRLPGGGVVVACQDKDHKYRVEEVGPGGKTGWRVQSDRSPLGLLGPFPLLALGF